MTQWLYTQLNIVHWKVGAGVKMATILARQSGRIQEDIFLSFVVLFCVLLRHLPVVSFHNNADNPTTLKSDVCACAYCLEGVHL